MTDSLFVQILYEAQKLNASLQDLNQNLQGSNPFFDWSILIPVILGVCGAIFTVYQLKFNKLSSARIEWLQTFRKRTSELLKNSSNLYGQLDKMRFEKEHRNKEISKDELIKKTLTEYSETLIPLSAKNKDLISNVRLMLNPSKDNEHEEHRLLDDVLVKYEDEIEKILVDDNPKKIINNIEKLESKIIRHSRKIIKEAWEESKNFIQ